MAACGPLQEFRKVESWYSSHWSDWADAVSSSTVQESKLGFQCMAESRERGRKTLA